MTNKEGRTNKKLIGKEKEEIDKEEVEIEMRKTDRRGGVRKRGRM